MLQQEDSLMKPGSSDYVGHYVRAVYDFETSHPREITLHKGDIIKVTRSVDNNWLHGSNRNSEGNFPSSFVEKVVMPPVGHGQKVFGAIENFPAQQDGDLEFRKGMVIEGVKMIDDNWWQGNIGSQTGIFPLTHVIELEVPKNLLDRAASIHSAEPMFARALCDSAAQLDEELGFNTGDIVTVTEIIDDDWYYGELGNKKGMFLSACVELIQDTYSLAEKNQSNQLTHSTNDNVQSGKELTRQTAVDQPSLNSNHDNNKHSESFSDKSSDIYANYEPSQPEMYSEPQSEPQDSPEFNTQYSYTNENTKSLETDISPYGMTLYPFVGESQGELSFNENEIVYLIQHVDSQWIEGQIDDKIGIFPSSFVSIVVDCPYAYDTDSSAPDLVEKEAVNENSGLSETKIFKTNEADVKLELSAPSEYGLVLFDFTGEVEGDLNVFTGETVEIIKYVDDNWVQAKNDQEQIGVLPKQFLDIVSEVDTSSKSDSGFQSGESSFTNTSISDTYVNHSAVNDLKQNVQEQKDLKFPTEQETTSTNAKQETTSTHSEKKIVERKNGITNSNPDVFKKPSLPVKPKPSLAPKPILKPKPASLKPVTKTDSKSGQVKISVNSKTTCMSKSLTFQDGQDISKVSSQKSVKLSDYIPKSRSSSELSSLNSGINTSVKRNHSLALSDIDSMVKSEIKKEMTRTDTLSDDSGKGSLTEEMDEKISKAVHKDATIQTKLDNDKKRHSVNFPITDVLKPKTVNPENRQSLAFLDSANFTNSSETMTKVGYSTFFTDLEPASSVRQRPIPMRKPPPPPQKAESVDFNRKPSLRKPPPPRPTVPKDRPLSPTSASTTLKSKKVDKSNKDLQKGPRQHIKPTRPAPQRPAPGQIPNRPPPRSPAVPTDNLMSLSPTEEKEEDTNIEIIEDLKQRIKEVENDLEKYKKSKEELEFSQKNDGDNAEIHDNIEFYTANIEGLTQELESLKENLHKVLPSSELDEVARQMAEEERRKEEERKLEEAKQRAEVERQKRRDKRERVIEELIQTERDFLHGLHLCIETFVSPAAEKHPSVDVEAVFGNMEDVAHVSQRLLTLLEDAVNGKEFKDQILGTCFTKLCDDMKNAYAPYCRNHDEVIAILEKYKEDPSIQQYFNAKLNELREKIVVFDLEALLIKPVQRILKYPLLLNELIKSTEDSHKDKIEILNGINAMTEVATAINEYKRRKDLVYKYKRDTDQSLGDMLSKINLHSLRKKGSRFKGRISTNLGISPQTKDEEFTRVESKYREIERTVKIFTKDVQTYMDQIQDAYNCHEGVVIDLLDFYDDKACPEVQKYYKLYKVIHEKYLTEFVSTVSEVVIGPLNTLIVLFNGPNKVIQKRFDKLLDFDSLQRKEEKGSEKSLQEAKQNYLALNAQLLDELPKMYSLSLKLLQDCVGSFVGAQKQFYSSIMKSMTEILGMSLLMDTEGTVVDNFNIRHTAMVDKLSVLRIIPKGFNPKMESLGKPAVGKSTDKKSKRMSLQDPSASLLPSIPSSEQSDSQRVFVQQKYPSDKVYHVCQTYTATDAMDLSVIEGSCVGVIMDKDPMGNKERWFVDNGASKGFVPKSVLRQHKPSTDTTSMATSLYPSIDQQVSNESSDLIGQVSQHSSPDISVTDYSIGAPTTNQNEEEDLDFAFEEDMSPNISAEEFYHAAYPFEARNSNEISLFQGQVVTVLIKHDQENNPEWWFVDADGVKGYAPSNYLQPMN